MIERDAGGRSRLVHQVVGEHGVRSGKRPRWVTVGRIQLHRDKTVPQLFLQKGEALCWYERVATEP